MIGDSERVVRSLSPLKGQANPPVREYLISQRATALYFADVDRLLIGTACGVICLRVDVINAGRAT